MNYEIPRNSDFKTPFSNYLIRNKTIWNKFLKY